MDPAQITLWLQMVAMIAQLLQQLNIIPKPAAPKSVSLGSGGPTLTPEQSQELMVHLAAVHIATAVIGK